jgi:acyl transferase domain-containing protein
MASTWQLPDGKGSTATGHPLLGQRLPMPLPIFQTRISAASLPYLADRHIHGLVLLPETSYVEMALAAAVKAFGPGPYSLAEIVIQEALALSETELRTIQVALTPGEDGVTLFQIFSLEEGETNADSAQKADVAKPAVLWRLHVSGRITSGADTTSGGNPTPVEAMQTRFR